MSTLALQPPQARAAGSRALLMLMGASTFINLYAAQPLLPLLSRVFHATMAQVGWTVSATTLAVALASPLAGLLVDRFERRHVIGWSLFAIAIATMAASLAPSLPVLVGARFLQGLFIPASYVATVALVGELWPRERAGAAMATYVTGNVLGGFAGRMLAGFLAAHGGWQEAFLVLGALDLVAAAVVAFWLAQLPPTARHEGAVPDLKLLRSLFVDPRLTPIYTVGAVMLFTLVGLFTYVDFYLEAPPFGLGTAALGSVFMVYALGVVVTPIAGGLIDRLGFRRVGAVSLAATALGIALTLVPLLPVVVAGLAIAACGVFIGQACATSFLGVQAGAQRGPAAGLYLACYYTGGSLGGLLPSQAWALGAWPACAGLLIAAALLAVTLMLHSWRTVSGTTSFR